MCTGKRGLPHLSNQHPGPMWNPVFGCDQYENFFFRPFVFTFPLPSPPVKEGGRSEDGEWKRGSAWVTEWEIVRRDHAGKPDRSTCRLILVMRTSSVDLYLFFPSETDHSRNREHHPNHKKFLLRLTLLPKLVVALPLVLLAIIMIINNIN